jgi:acetate kinase
LLAGQVEGLGIDADDSAVRLRVLRTNEEAVIARHTARAASVCA